MKKKLLSALLGIAMVASMIPAAFASDLDGHWAKTFIEYLDQEGVINASATTGNYEPDRDMTRAEFMRYINRAFHFTEEASISFSDVQTNAWYYDTIQIAVNYGYINGVGNNRMDPLGEVTREQAAVIIGRLYKDDPGDVSASDLPFSDRNEVSSWAAGYIKAAVDNGIITGYEDGTFRPQNVVTRGEVAKIIYYYLGTSLSTAGKAYTGSDLKSDTDNVTISESCTLSNATIDGDLYITEGVGSDTVTLNNVQVNGTLIVSGGTVTMVNTTSDHVIVSSPMGRLLQVTATGATRIAETEVHTAASLNERGLSLGGTGFADVLVQGDSRVSLTIDAEIDGLDLESEATVSTSDNAMIYNMQARAETSVTGYGSVYQANIYTNGVSFASSVTVSGYELASGVSATINGDEVWTSSKPGVVPKEISIDLADLDEIGSGIEVTVPAGTSVEEVLCSSRILDEGSDYTLTSAGMRLDTDWLESLSRGDYTILILLSSGDRASISLEVSNSSPTADSHEAYFDRYYDSSDYRDVSVRLDHVYDEDDIEAVVFGWEEIDDSNYSFSSSSRTLTLERSWLSKLREGTYTITVEIYGEDDETILLTVDDSSPDDGETIEYDWDGMGDDIWIDLPADRVSEIENVTVFYDDDDRDDSLYIEDYEDYDSDYDDDYYDSCWLDCDYEELMFTAETVDHYMSWNYDDRIVFEIELSNGDLYTLIVYDYS